DDINKAGIKPDIKVELSDEQRQNLWLKQRDKLATLQDPQFAKAVEQLKKEIAGTSNIRVQRQ
ncbi:MAG: peptidase S41, partial [Cyanobacteria bacterium P01_D01_bin.116]